jgi:hypothetical protein
MGGSGELPSPFLLKEETLNKIWDNIKRGEYTKIANQLTETYGEIAILYPEPVYSNEAGDMMTIPVNGGYKRDTYMRKTDDEWHKPY